MRKKIAIIGAGTAGLYTALAFDETLDKEKYEFIVYERMSNVGGLWNFTENVGIDSLDGLPVHGPMYKNLMTNGPNELGELYFTDLFKEDEQGYVNQEQYIKSFVQLAEQYNLYKYIKCHHYIRMVKKLAKGFHLEILNTVTKETLSENFDFVIVAAGRYTIPKWPNAETELLKKFSGECFHSKDIKDTNKYNDKRVLCIGSGFSALDIGLLLHKGGAPLVTINGKPGLVTDNCTYSWEDNFKMVMNPVKSVNGKRITFEDGSSDEFDCVIVCTGFLCEFPFLENRLQPVNNNSIFPHLYEAIFDINHPELMFVGVFYTFLPKIFAYIQGHFIRSILNDDMKNLPSKNQMEEAIQTWYTQIPKGSNLDPFLQFHYDYYYKLQEACPRKVFDRRYEKLLIYNLELLLAGTHLEKMDKGLKDFD